MIAFLPFLLEFKQLIIFNIGLLCQNMHQYKRNLNFLTEVVLLGEFGILFLRFISQVVFTFPTLLSMLQLLLASAMHCHNNCRDESKIYLFINLFILYILLYNTLELIAGNSFTNEFFLVEKFQNSYKNWGYCLQIVFRIVSETIAWRAHQFADYYQRILQRL